MRTEALTKLLRLGVAVMIPIVICLIPNLVFAQSLTVTWPDDSGLDWEANTPRPIWWTSSGVANVDIEYSINGGSDWEPVVASFPSSDGENTFWWDVPSTTGMPSDQCLVKISDTASSVYDESPCCFTISTKIYVDVPDGGDVWGVGDPRTIVWHGSQPPGSPVKIELSTSGPGGPWTVVDGNAPNEPDAQHISRYAWTVLDSPSTQCRIRITNAGDTTPTDMSESDFTIVRRGTIVVEKQTEPDGAPDLFTFTGDAAGTISDDEQIVPPGLFPGVYTSQEIVPEGWFLTRIECSDTDSTGDLETATATFNLDAGELVQCTFTNSRAASIGDIVFRDYNANGAQDPGEPGIPGVEVCLYAEESNGQAISIQAAGPDRPCGGELAACMDTMADGSYVFENLNPYDTYCVIIPNPPEGVYLSAGMNPRDIPPLAPGEAYDLADFPFRFSMPIPTVTPWGVLILGLLVAASAVWIIRRRKRVL